MTNCRYCGKELEGKVRRYCNSECKYSFEHPQPKVTISTLRDSLMQVEYFLDHYHGKNLEGFLAVKERILANIQKLQKGEQL